MIYGFWCIISVCVQLKWCLRSVRTDYISQTISWILNCEFCKTINLVDGRTCSVEMFTLLLLHFYPRICEQQMTRTPLEAAAPLSLWRMLWIESSMLHVSDEEPAHHKYITDATTIPRMKILQPQFTWSILNFFAAWRHILHIFTLLNGPGSQWMFFLFVQRPQSNLKCIKGT